MPPTEEWKRKSSQAWIDFCDYIEEKGGPAGEFLSEHILKKIVVNAPVLLSFVLLCVVIHVLSCILPIPLNKWLGMDDSFTQWWNPFSYVSFFSHVFAHSGWGHLQGNMVHLLLCGPAVEHGFGSRNLFLIIVLVAVTSAFVHLAIGKEHTYQLGASGVVFACILLSSLVTATNGTIPLSFVIVAVWWMGGEFWNFFFAGDAVSHHAHISGGIVGTLAGYYIHRQNKQEEIEQMASRWLSSARQMATAAANKVIGGGRSGDATKSAPTKKTK